jgi:nitrilase
MDREATTKKVVSLTLEAGEKGANLVLFPEAFIPAYPRGLSFGTKVGDRSESGRKDWFRYWNNSVPVPSEPGYELNCRRSFGFCHLCHRFRILYYSK